MNEYTESVYFLLDDCTPLTIGAAKGLKNDAIIVVCYLPKTVPVSFDEPFRR